MAEEANALDLSEWADDPGVEEVQIGKRTVKVTGLTDPSVIQEILTVGKAQVGLPIQIDGEEIRLADGEPTCYRALEAGLVEPKLSFTDILRISRKTGFDCVNAGTRVLFLSKLGEEALDAAKNALREASEGAKPTPGSDGPSPPAKG